MGAVQAHTTVTFVRWKGSWPRYWNSFSCHTLCRYLLRFDWLTGIIAFIKLLLLLPAVTTESDTDLLDVRHGCVLPTMHYCGSAFASIVSMKNRQPVISYVAGLIFFPFLKKGRPLWMSVSERMIRGDETTTISSCLQCTYLWLSAGKMGECIPAALVLLLHMSAWYRKEMGTHLMVLKSLCVVCPCGGLFWHQWSCRWDIVSIVGTCVYYARHVAGREITCMLWNFLGGLNRS